MSVIYVLSILFLVNGAYAQVDGFGPIEFTAREGCSMGGKQLQNYINMIGREALIQCTEKEVPDGYQPNDTRP